MSNDATATTVMLGLPGFRVLAVSEHAGELEQAVETTAEDGWCPECGVHARLHDRRPSWLRDLPAGGRPVTLVWVKRIWRCTKPLIDDSEPVVELNVHGVPSGNVTSTS